MDEDIKQISEDLSKSPFDQDLVELLFEKLSGTLEQWRHAIQEGDPYEAESGRFNRIERVIMNQLNSKMQSLGMFDVQSDLKYRFNQRYIENCHNLLEAITQADVADDFDKSMRLMIQLFDKLKVYK